MKFYILLLVSIGLVGCKSSQKTVTVIPNDKNVTVKKDAKPASKKISAIIKTAYSYEGTPYKYGGITKKGMDCSGLVHTAFKKNDVALERSSYNMATQGKKISLRAVTVGDLLFFKTANSSRINHVGLVVDVNKNDIQFIHATNSRGVIVSSLNEKYWDNAFTQVRRVL